MVLLNELRVGSLVTYNGKLCKVVALDSENIKGKDQAIRIKEISDDYDNSSFGTWMSKIEGARVDKDYLLRLGFIECTGKWGVYYKHNAYVGFRVWFDKDGNVLYIGLKNYIKDTINVCSTFAMLHELQNAFLVLVKEELNY